MNTPDEFETKQTAGGLGDCPDKQEILPGTSLGRYVIIEPIGSGGMGTVYRAYDPELNRGIALKILSVKQNDHQAAEKAKTRLIREAQALAQLSHPNVVAVYDVGSFDDDVFIAMELVKGKTLEAVMKTKTYTSHEILEIMKAAGSGLAAAHKAGLIHRDFKPGNVIIGDDERVRVLDFGLARAVSVEEIGEDRPEVFDPGDEQSEDAQNLLQLMEVSSSSTPNLLFSSLTHDGSILGTPMYMSPEQFLGKITDERTDQFGYCVVLYEALYGTRPFAAKTITELKSEVVRQNVCIPPTDSDVPTWLWQVIRKGLSANPKSRYPTLEMLLEDLGKDPQEIHRQKRLRRRRKLFVISLIVLSVLIPIGVWYGLRYQAFQSCKATQRELHGVWDDATKASIQEAFINTKKSFAMGTWKRVKQNFDQYLDDWTRMRSDVCEARLVHGTQSEELFDLRMRCLQKRFEELRALVTVFVKADSRVVQRAAQASASLDMISLCADEEALRAPYPPPKTVEDKTKVAEIQKKLLEIDALHKAGKFKEGLKLAKELENEARAVDYRPVQAETLCSIGTLFEKTGEYKKAETTLLEAAKVAGESKHALLAAKAMALLVGVVGSRQARHEDGVLLGQSAEVVLGLAGENDNSRALLLNNMGLLYAALGKGGKALDSHRRALAIREKALGSEHALVAASLGNMSIVLQLQGDYDNPLAYLRRALSIQEKALGPKHPWVADTLGNIGCLFLRKGKYDKALEYLGKTLAIQKNAFGFEHPFIAMTLSNMGFAYRKKGEYDKALESLRRSLAIDEKALGPEHPYVSQTLNDIGNLLIDKGTPQQAVELFERTLRICPEETCEEKSFGPARFGLARALVASGKGKHRALKLAQQAREMFEGNQRSS